MRCRLQFELKMGSNSSSESIDFLLDNYNLLREENGLKVLEEKRSLQTFVLKEQCFVNKNEYDRSFKRLAQRDQDNDCDNILQMVKIWSKEHNGICSNLFKIFTVYEYPQVKLIEEIDARKKEMKYFEEIELFSILQSCMNALRLQSYINVSPHLVFILPEGILKMIHTDLLDPHYRTVYNEEYYYSPEKIENFNRTVADSLEDNEREVMFSLGMTLLHSALLESPMPCYEISLRRFNKKKLSAMQQQLKNQYSPALIEILNSMLQPNPINRITFGELEGMVNEYFMTNGQSMINSFSEQARISSNLKLNTNQIVSKVQDVSLIYSGETLMHIPSVQKCQLPLNSNSKQIRKSQFEILFDQQGRESMNLPKNHHILQKSKRSKVAQTNEINKENMYTDPKIMDMIKSGVQQINKTTKDRIVSRDIGPKDDKRPIMASQQDMLSEYELVSSSKSRCTFVVQTNQDNSRFQGMVQDNMKNGYGRLTYPDGVYYEGNFKNDTLQGKGSLYYGPNRPAYIGEWVNNKFNGKGTLFNEYSSPLENSFNYHDFNKIGDHWIKFQGTFIDDIKQGQGKITLANGETMQGNFSKGLLNGLGAFTNIQGVVVQGRWQNNIFTQ